MRNSCSAAVIQPELESHDISGYSSNSLTGDSDLNGVQSKVDRQLEDNDTGASSETEGDLSSPVLNDVSEEEQFSTGAEKRGSFNSWGGKRAGFNSWGGKRAGFNSWGGKRAGFNSWGGKRSDEGLDMDKRAKFSSWGGKRTFNIGELKRKFNAWGGKRSEDSDSWDPRKRAKFNSWGGKRADDMTTDLDTEKRAKFNSWGGKRSEGLAMEEDKRAKFSSWGGKRSQLEDLLEKRAKFNSWGGKRSDEDVKRKFNAWGGKRNADYNLGKDILFTCFLLKTLTTFCAIRKIKRFNIFGETFGPINIGIPLPNLQTHSIGSNT